MWGSLAPGGIRSRYDVVVIGAGPAGCVAAACLSKRGASVLLVESSPKAAGRFAGEWIHPRGVRVLRDRGLLKGLAPLAVARGFAVFPNDGLGAIRLDYARGSGICCEHETFVTHLRSRVRDLHGVQYLENVRARIAGSESIELSDRAGGTLRLNAGRIVVAAGRSWRAEGSEDRRRNQVSLSRMAGLTIDAHRLPCEGYGHVVLGGPGPVLAYRIDEHRARMCIDVPISLPRGAGTKEWIWTSFADVLPPPLRAGLCDALDRCAPSWAMTSFRPRFPRSAQNVTLIGDAAGVLHPLTAMGITMSLLDAEALQSDDFVDQARRRSDEAFVPELLSNAIYQAFVRDDPSAEAIRQAMFRTWRSSRQHRERTMRLLGVETSRRSDFVRSFSTVALGAAIDSLRLDPRNLAELASWLRWPGASLHPTSSVVRERSVSWAMPPSWSGRDIGGAPAALEGRELAS